MTSTSARGLLDRLERMLGPAGARVYLQPAGLLAGRAARDAVAAGMALPVAGGPLAMLACEVLVRDEHGRGQGVLVDAPGVAAWARRSDHPGAARVAELLDRIRAPRPASAQRPRLMGVVNVTPDSFSDGGAWLDPASALARCEALLAEGADVLDVGGESTRPGAQPVDPEVEAARVRPVLEALQARRARMPGVQISIDTRHATTMRLALSLGADILNDVTALTGDPDSLSVAASGSARVVLMHMLGRPATMNEAPAYADLALDVFDFLEARVEACVAAGIGRDRLIVDPGLGFGKRGSQNVELLGRFALFHGLGCPLLLGVSRKGLGAGLEGLAPVERVPSSLGAAMHALGQGVQILRVHDVAATRQVVDLWYRLASPDVSP